MAYPNFAPTNYASVSALVGISSRYALPGGGGATVLVTNIGPSAIVALLGDNTVAVTFATGVVVAPNQALPLAVGSAGYVAVIGVHGTAVVNLAQGT